MPCSRHCRLTTRDAPREIRKPFGPESTTAELAGAGLPFPHMDALLWLSHSSAGLRLDEEPWERVLRARRGTQEVDT